MAIIAFFNLKGGVGKTTACVNVAALAASSGASSLLIDLDPQGAASYHLRILPPDDLDAEKYLKGAGALRKRIKASDVPNLAVLAAGLELRDLATELDGMKHRKRYLGEIFLELGKDYDWVFIDTPPGISIEVENVLRVAAAIVMPVIPSPLGRNAFETARIFFAESGIKENILRCFFSQVDRRKSLHKHMMEDLRTAFNGYLETTVPFRSEIERASERQGVLSITRPQSEGGLTFKALWDELALSLLSRK